MGNLSAINALQRTPRLKSLYQRLTQAEVERPGWLLVADSPFFILPNGDLYTGEIIDVRYMPVWRIRKEFVLKRELDYIAHEAALGNYAEDQMKFFEDWALGALHFVKESVRIADRIEIRKLRKANLLN